MRVFRDAIVPAMVGAGILLVGRAVLPALAEGLRPAAKKGIRGYLKLAARAKEATAEAKERWSDLVAEAEAEMGQEAESPAESAG